MPSARRGYRLVVYELRLDPHMFRDIIAGELDLHPTDAMRLASHAPGVIPCGLTKARAFRLARKLASVGVELGVLPVDKLPDLSEPQVVHKVDCREDGLETFGLRGEPMHWVPWDQVDLISVGEFPERKKELNLSAPTWLSVSVGVMRTIVMGYRRAGTSVRKLVQTSVSELWLVRRRPVQALRIQQERMNYEYLGDRRAPSTRANFRLLVEDLLRFAPQATITPATHSFLVYERPGQHFFSSAQELMEYTTLQLLRRWHIQVKDDFVDQEPPDEPTVS